MRRITDHWIKYETNFKYVLFEHWSKPALMEQVRYYLRKIFENDDFEIEYRKVIDNIKIYSGDRLCK